MFCYLTFSWDYYLIDKKFGFLLDDEIFELFFSGYKLRCSGVWIDSDIDENKSRLSSITRLLERLNVLSD